MNEEYHNKPIPILRSFETEKTKYLHGYACLFNIPDEYGTAMTREAVEANQQRLRKFPAVRFMHKTPFGQIVWDKEVSGVKTRIDDNGFHVLIKVYDSAEKEWSMVTSGKWGLSYGFLPAPDGIKRVCPSPQNCYDAFVHGTLYEISVVDTPAQDDAIAHILRSITNGHFARTGQRKMLTMEGYDIYEISPNGERCVYTSKPTEPIMRPSKQAKPFTRSLKIQTPPTTNLQQHWRHQTFPEICSDSCPHVQCPYRREENFGKKCLQQLEQFKTAPTWLSDPLERVPVLKSFIPNEDD
jgi:phage head maturation protease